MQYSPSLSYTVLSVTSYSAIHFHYPSPPPPVTLPAPILCTHSSFTPCPFTPALSYSRPSLPFFSSPLFHLSATIRMRSSDSSRLTRMLSRVVWGTVRALSAYWTLQGSSPSTGESTVLATITHTMLLTELYPILHYGPFCTSYFASLLP
jgi:hypothetical protein